VRDVQEQQGNAWRAQRVHELGLKLIALIVATVAAFGITEGVAAQMRQRTRQDAKAFYANGLAARRSGQLDAAITAFRRASTKDRDNLDYTLQLSRALAADGQLDAAERSFLALRERVPDNPDVNLELARLAVRRDDAAMALRYYRYALYAPWPDASGPRTVRRELIAFLLDHGDRDRALAELIAARSNTPDTAAAHVELGGLLLRADDPRLAAEEFRRALVLAPEDATARRLAGEAAFRLGDYAAAARDLADAAATDPAAGDMHRTAVAVLRDDPLAPRIPAQERLNRMMRLLDRASQRASSCGPAPASGDQKPLDAIARAVRRSGGRDTGTLEDALDAAYGLTRQFADSCAGATADDRALLIIGERHQAASR
jgi:tetratricopeptide (TPR) repeat protein